MGSVGGRTVAALLLAAVLGGCAKAADDDGRRASSASPDAKAEGSGGTTAARGGTVGARGSACELPVGFDVARGWQPKAIDAGAASAEASATSNASEGSDDDLGAAIADALLRQGPVTAACEIDAKPAGSIGFLRVWTGKPGGADAGGVLRAFVAAEEHVSKAKYHRFTTGGGVPAVAVEYLTTSELLDEAKEESAFAVSTAAGPVVLHLGGMDTGEHERMRPAYDLAQRSLTLS
ncbi:lipoprotein [Streptomyces sp. LP11]|uniref:Lipoprotein n=1 Tax=Streptomyces pyxinicus TaxID=2970331 RepID=A0ABT2B2D5_9ACTN|nr:lipoprotein [Streptomyces sp. LP11]MCS0602651.1 lipoprotein [Streptomyces sp. LP11]